MEWVTYESHLITCAPSLLNSSLSLGIASFRSTALPIHSMGSLLVPVGNRLASGCLTRFRAPIIRYSTSRVFHTDGPLLVARTCPLLGRSMLRTVWTSNGVV